MRPDDRVPGDTGRNGYAEPNDRPDDRKQEINRRPFWADESEELRWLYAVEECRKFRGEPMLQHLQRIAEMVSGAKVAEPAKQMPEVRLPYADDSAA